METRVTVETRVIEVATGIGATSAVTNAPRPRHPIHHPEDPTRAARAASGFGSSRKAEIFAAEADPVAAASAAPGVEAAGPMEVAKPAVGVGVVLAVSEADPPLPPLAARPKRCPANARRR